MFPHSPVKSIFQSEVKLTFEKMYRYQKIDDGDLKSDLLINIEFVMIT